MNDFSSSSVSLKEIANIFDEIAVLLELKGENPFRVRAFVNASRILRSSDLNTEQFLYQLRDGKIRGFGSQLTDYVRIAVDSKSVPYLEELRGQFPEGILELLQLPGLGVKKVKLLHEELSIENMQELENACRENRLSKIKGFGKKAQENLLGGIQRYHSYRKYERYDVIEKTAIEIVQSLKRSPLCYQASLAGSARRKNEIVRDINIVASSDAPTELITTFLRHPEIESYKSALSREKPSGRASVVLKNGCNVELRIVPDEEYAAALIHFTGNEGHSSALKGLAKEAQLSFTPQGLFRNGNRVPTNSEENIYAALGLVFIPAERRENRGEITLAKQGFQEQKDVFERLSLSDIRGVIHVHTTYSDGKDHLEPLAKAVRDFGYKYLGVSDHSRSAAYARGLQIDDIKRQHEEINRLNETLSPFKIFKGIESDILADGSLDYPDSVLETFDFVIASVHSRMKMNKEEMTKRVICAVGNPYTTILGHPTGRLLLQREPYAIDLDQVLETAAEQGVAVEINANPKRLDLDWRYHQKAKKLGLTIPICPDAHSIQRVHDMSYGIGVARKGGLSSRDVLNCWDVNKVEDFFALKV